MNIKQKERFDSIANAMEVKKRADGTEYHCISDTCEDGLKDVLMKLIYDDNIGGSSDLSYEICYQATAVLTDDVTEEQISSEDFYIHEHIQDIASVYTAIRLSYLNNNNQDEITDTLKEYSTDIAGACAVWYENMIAQACNDIIDYVKAK